MTKPTRLFSKLTIILMLIRLYNFKYIITPYTCYYSFLTNLTMFIILFFFHLLFTPLTLYNFI